jgi:multicomponent Na+:H+ antiporter subunit B
MRRRNRFILFFPSALVLAGVFAYAFAGLPPLGDYKGPYGDLVNALVVPERHVTDAVTAVNFDIRGFDTLGEEFILFTSVMAVALLLRIQRAEQAQQHADQVEGREIDRASDAVRVCALLLVGPCALYGIYIIAHGQLTPGGGFQGGVILASAPLLLYLATEFHSFRAAVPRPLVHAAEVIGAAAYPAIGIAALAAGGAFLENVLPLGTKGSIVSGGTIPLINWGVGLEVSGGIALVLLVFLEETLEWKEE